MVIHEPIAKRNDVNKTVVGIMEIGVALIMRKGGNSGFCDHKQAY